VPVERATVHHQGGGAPTDNSSGYSHGGYSYGIGATRWERFRSPQDSYATLNYNHVSLDICLSGSRGNTDPAYQVTDHDLELIHGAFMDCFNRGEVVAMPLVVAHKNSPGSQTVCPGDNTMARWNEVVRAVSNQSQPRPPTPEEFEMQMASAINKAGVPNVFQVGGDGKLYNRWRETGGGWSGWNDLSGGKSQFVAVTALKVPAGEINVWVTMRDGKSFFRYETEDPAKPWSDWKAG